MKTLYEGGSAYTSKVASTYESDRKDEEHWQFEHAFIENYFMGNHVQSILDIPIGTGRFISLYPHGADIVGMDISPAMLVEARKKVGFNNSNLVRLIEGDATNLHQLPAKSVEIIVCFRLLHLVQDEIRRAILAEFARVFSGRLLLQVYISEPDTRSKRSFVWLKLKAFIYFSRSILQFVLPSKRKPWHHIKSYKLEMVTLEKLLEQTNLKIIRKNLLCRYLNEDVYVIEIAHLNDPHD